MKKIALYRTIIIKINDGMDCTVFHKNGSSFPKLVDKQWINSKRPLSNIIKALVADEIKSVLNSEFITQ